MYYTPPEHFTLQPLQWVYTTSTTGIKRLVAKSVAKQLGIQQSQSNKTFTVDIYTERDSWNLHYGCKTIEEAKELAWQEHCKQLRNCILPADLVSDMQKELPL